MRRRRRQRGHGDKRGPEQQGPGLGQTPGQGPQQQNQNPPRQRGHGITGALSHDVDREVRQRGEAYFRQGRVHGPVATAERLSAEVRGKGGTYQVTIDLGNDPSRDRSLISALCNCPFFTEGRGCCKHIWAALCLADQTPDCLFKSTPGRAVGISNRAISVPRIPTVVSAGPDMRPW